MRLILYSKPGCHLCEGLLEKLQQIEGLNLEIEIRDITTREDWWQVYQYEIPVLCAETASAQGAGVVEKQLPRLSARASAEQLKTRLQKHLPIA